jgi:hypothetical protein
LEARWKEYKVVACATCHKDHTAPIPQVEARSFWISDAAAQVEASRDFLSFSVFEATELDEISVPLVVVEK